MFPSKDLRTGNLVLVWLTVLSLGIAALFVASPGTLRAAAAAVQAAATGGNADYSVAVSPSKQSVQVGKAVSYSVTVTAVNGFTGTVSLTTSGLPTGTTASPNPTTLSMMASGSVQSYALTLTTTKTTPLGDFTFTVTGTSGKLKRTATAVLTVGKTPGSLSLAMDPGSVNVSPGGTTAYNLALTRTGSVTDAPVTLSLVGQPAGSTVAFAPNPATGTSASLSLTVPTTASAGTYTLTVTGKPSTGETATATATLSVVYSARSFTIRSGLLPVLSPGVSVPLDLLLQNPNNRAISITNLGAVVSTTSAACTSENFAVTQYSGTYPLSLGAGQARLLSELLKAANPGTTLVQQQAMLPRLGMRNLNRSQDGCKAGASPGDFIKLTYSGSATGD